MCNVGDQWDVTCGTEGCINGGVTIRLTTKEDTPDALPTVMCGPCESLISSVIAV